MEFEDLERRKFFEMTIYYLQDTNWANVHHIHMEFCRSLRSGIISIFSAKYWSTQESKPKIEENYLQNAKMKHFKIWRNTFELKSKIAFHFISNGWQRTVSWKRYHLIFELQCGRPDQAFSLLIYRTGSKENLKRIEHRVFLVRNVSFGSVTIFKVK